METRERILAATTELFGRFGYTGTGLKQIGSQAEAPFGSIYHHFPGGKEDLGERVIRQAGRLYLDLVMGMVQSAADPVTAVRSTFRAAADVLAATDYRDACPVATVALEVASSNDRLRAATAAVFDEWITAVAGYLTSAGVPAASAVSLAMVLIELLEGAFLLSRAARDTAPMLAAADAAAGLVGAFAGAPGGEAGQ